MFKVSLCLYGSACFDSWWHLSLPPQSSLQLGRKQYAILGEIPPGKWITSREISENIDITPRVISAVIRSDLLFKYVERRAVKKSTGATSYEYRRRVIIGFYGERGRLEQL